MKLNTIFLDIDDVCNRFTLFAAAMMGAPIDYHDESVWNPAWGRNLVHGTNKLADTEYTLNSFWGKLPEKAWSETPISEEFGMLLRTCSSIVGRTNVCFLSTPTLCPLSCSGKLKWIQKYAPKWMHRQYLLGPPKHLCAKSDTLLIDDTTENATRFKLVGGQALLLPRPWNIHHQIAAKGLTEEYLKVELELVQRGAGKWQQEPRSGKN